MLLEGAALVALALSTQFFFQPFVWRYWPIDQVLAGWANVFLDNLLLVVPVAGVLIVVGRGKIAAPASRLLWVAAAIGFGAIAGDLLDQLRTGETSPLMAMLLQSLRIILVVGSVLAMVAIWRGGTATAAEAADLRAWHAEVQAAADVNELEALRRQIEPHFLFNTLATVQQLRASDGAAGHAMLVRLLVYVRQSIAVAAAARVRLGDEIALVDVYLAICQLRMGDRLAVRIDVPDHLDNAAIPPLTLITLVENAIKHGLAPSPTGGSIAVIARQDVGMLELLVIDDGIGLGLLDSGHGIGLANTLRRLRLAFGSNTALSLLANDPH